MTPQLTQEQAQFVRACRQRAESNDTLELQEKRQKFLGWINGWCYEPTETEVIQGKYGDVYDVVKAPLMTCEMYPQENDEPLKSPLRIYQGFSRWHNTRTKLLCETCFEVDKLSIEKSIVVINEVILALMKHKIHFAVFYARGQRSPHIKIYDLRELEELTPYQREKAQALFWRKLVPFFLHYADASMWSDGHWYPLEFAPHWKYFTPFELILEWIPAQEELTCSI